MQPRTAQRSRTCAGQALVELALSFTVMFLMAYGFYEIYRVASLTHRLVSSAREGGRIFIAEDISPSVGLSQAENKTLLQTTIETKVYNNIKDMIAPADLPNKGKVIVSIIRRYDGHDRNPAKPRTDYADPTTEVDDTIEVEYQFNYPSTSPANWNSQWGNEGTVIPTSRIALGSLRIDERTVSVEVFHRTEIMGAVQNLLNQAGFEYVYDMALF